ncbi:putative peroxisomal carrier protein [Microthyrium microscopicum]|uniref:Putative peroxisomal carrier protein n=1 Tax=Microthyrium microscopicum TaxID=703497 RepID=A0A6A6TVW7_9PEZI|nr:putative peroxisomal carrier protein [Microthyrium microscopicum]
MANHSEPLPPLIYAISGSAASVVANTLIYPLDRVKTKLQVQSTQDADKLSKDAYYDGVSDAIIKIVKTEGLAGLYVGMPGSLIGSASQGYAFNYWHSFLRQFYISSSAFTQPPGTIAELILAFGSSALTQFTTIPVSVVTTRQQTTPKEDRKDLIGTAKDVIHSEDGVSGLWKGLKAALVLCINPAITYGTTERLRVLLFKGREVLKPWESFLLGVISKAIATVISQPMIVARVGLQSKPPPSRNGIPFKTWGEVMSYIIKNEGILRLWKGLGPQLSKAILVQGLMTILKERFRNQLAIAYYFAQRTRKSQRLSGAFIAGKTTNQTLLTKV